MSGRYDDTLIDARKAVEARRLRRRREPGFLYLTTAGYANEAVVHRKNAMALNPNYPPNYLGNLGFALRLADRVEEDDPRVQGL